MEVREYIKEGEKNDKPDNSLRGQDHSTFEGWGWGISQCMNFLPPLINK